jgi:YgiT-type zinc finger domain-containing protein
MMEHLQRAYFSTSPGVACPNCSSQNTIQTVETDKFEYGLNEDLVILSADVPVHHCQECGMIFTDETASELRHNAVCQHLGIMNPTQVRSIRGSLSQNEFAALSKIGKASIARWEGGTSLQNPANDCYLYLLSFSDNVERLQERAILKEQKNTIIFGKFRSISAAEQAELRDAAERFELFSSIEASLCTQ